MEAKLKELRTDPRVTMFLLPMPKGSAKEPEKSSPSQAAPKPAAGPPTRPCSGTTRKDWRFCKSMLASAFIFITACTGVHATKRQDGGQSEDVFEPLTAFCDGNHKHATWNPKVIGSQLTFPTAEEAAYPVLLCKRVVALLLSYAFFFRSSSLSFRQVDQHAVACSWLIVIMFILGTRVNQELGLEKDQILSPMRSSQCQSNQKNQTKAKQTKTTTKQTTTKTKTKPTRTGQHERQSDILTWPPGQHS